MFFIHVIYIKATKLTVTPEVFSGAAVISGLALIGHNLPSGAGEKVTTPFNGKDLTGWKLRGDPKKSEWQIGHAVISELNPSELIMVPDGKGPTQMVDLKRSMDIYTEEKFGDCLIEVELMIPKGSNSGIYVMGEYEVQVLDSYGNKTYFDGQCASLYKQSPPMANVCKKPSEWQTYDIVFETPRFGDDGKLTKPGIVTVIHNGVVVQNHFELQGGTYYDRPASYERHPLKQPIRLQNHGNPVKYRNIWLRELTPIVGKKPGE